MRARVLTIAVLAGALAFAARSAPAVPASSDLNYVRDVAPLVAKLGCAAARCHGGSVARTDLRLSLFGDEPERDRDALVRGANGRRVNLREPEKSLLLGKLTGALPHADAAIVASGSPEHALLVSWLAGGAVAGVSSRDRATSLVASAELVRLEPSREHVLRITARYPDGSERDVTRLASFSSLDPAVATVDSHARIVAGRCGQTHVVASYARRFAVVRVVVPQKLPHGFPKVEPATRLDALVLAKLEELGIPPAPLASDEVFLRRVFLDVVGLLPTAAQAKAFLEDKDPAKRSKLIDRLLASDDFTDFWTLKWGDLLRIKSEFPVRVWPKAVAAYARFVRESIAANKPVDRFARELLTATGSNFRDGPANYYRAVPSKDAQSFAENTALVFMGARLGCARCHAHPSESWSLADDLGMAAFFGNVKFKATGEWKEEIVTIDPDAAFRDPVTKAVVTPKLLGGATVAIGSGEDGRARFAAWLTAPENPWFARNVANRVWSWLMGRGLVDEPDDVRGTNPPSNPKLLDHLARELVEHRFDLRHLYRAILNSRTYQTSSESDQWNEHDRTFASHYLVKRLGAEPLLDALSQVTETTESFSSQVPEPYTRLIDQRATRLIDGSVTDSFLELFGRPSRDTPFESERCNRLSMRQTLVLLNSADVERKVSSSGRLRRFVREKQTDEQVVDELYLAAFARFPSPLEKRRVVELISKDRKQRASALQDLLWAIVNSREFLFNH